MLIRPTEAGNGRLKGAGEDGVAVEIEADPGLGTLQWFHFGIKAPKDTHVRIVNAGASTYPRGWADRVIWGRSEHGLWGRLETKWHEGIVEFAHEAADGLAIYALFPPYPLGRLDLLRKRAEVRADADVAETGTTRSLRISLGDRDPGARQIWVIAGQHGGEHPAIWFADGLLDALLERESLPAGLRFHLVPIANSSGMLAGHLRTNELGQDPNRHWGRPADCREVGSLFDAMTAAGVDVLLDIHTDCEMGCIYFDVLDQWMETPAPLADLREGFERGLAERSGEMSFGQRYPWQAPPPSDLLAAMCAPAIERRFGAVAMTLELPMGRFRNAAGVEHVWTPERSLALGRVAASVLTELE